MGGAGLLPGALLVLPVTERCPSGLRIRLVPSKTRMKPKTVALDYPSLRVNVPIVCTNKRHKHMFCSVIFEDSGEMQNGVHVYREAK